MRFQHDNVPGGAGWGSLERRSDGLVSFEVKECRSMPQRTRVRYRISSRLLTLLNREVKIGVGERLVLQEDVSSIGRPTLW